MARCHWPDKALSFPLPPPFRRSLVRSIERKTTRKRRAEVRKSGRRSGAQRNCCWRSLHVGRQYPNTFQRTVVRREGDVLPRIGSVLHFLRKSDPNSAGIGGVHSALPDPGGSCSAIGAH